MSHSGDRGCFCGARVGLTSVGHVLNSPVNVFLEVRWVCVLAVKTPSMASESERGHLARSLRPPRSRNAFRRNRLNGVRAVDGARLTRLGGNGGRTGVGSR